MANNQKNKLVKELNQIEERKEVKKLEFTGNYFIYCNSYIKNVSEVLKRLNLTLNGLIELMYEKQIIIDKTNNKRYFIRILKTKFVSKKKNRNYANN